jgi:phosphatidylethanolamine/phosphatidyl-N-methylethanolamine N-methyltransferase
MKMSNRWNQLIYRLWAPVYDSTVNRFFQAGRQRAMDVLDLQPGESLLIVGAGTGADLPLLPEAAKGIGLDLNSEMLKKAKQKLPHCQAKIQLIQGDAQALCLMDNQFDAALLNLILSVVPDGTSCLSESLRALKPGGRVVIFDKFQPDDQKLALIRRLVNFFSTLLGTDITRKFGGISHGLPCILISDEPSLAGGLYRVIKIHRTEGEFPPISNGFN